jgi:hypothetical protein
MGGRNYNLCSRLARCNDFTAEPVTENPNLQGASGPVVGGRVMLTATTGAARRPSTAGRIADLGRRCHPGVSHSFWSRAVAALLQPPVTTYVVAVQILRSNSCQRRIWICP